MLYNLNQSVSWNLLSQLPASWTFEGSNNSSNWTILDSQNNYTEWNQGENVFTFNNDKSFKYYRINITKNNGASTYVVNLSIHEMQLWGYDNSTEKWEYKTPLSESKSGVALVELNKKIYSIGGLKNGAPIKTVEEYDPQTDTWTGKADLNIARYRASATVLDGKIYVTGGTIGSDTTSSVELYNPQTNEWSTVKNLPQPLSGHTSETVNGKILVIGGFNYFTNASDEVYEYDPLTDIWSTKAHLNIKRRYIDSTVISGKVYVVGGINDNLAILNSLEVYDPTNDTWTLKKEMSTRRWGLAVTTLNNELYAIGGFTDNATVSGTGSAKTEKYNPQTDSWTLVSSLNTPRGVISAVTLNNAIYAAGGSNGSDYYNVLEKYTTGEQQEVPDPTDPVEPTDPTDPQPTGIRAILVVTLNTGLEKEFDLSIEEVNAFITWYENKQAGTGPAAYAIDKHNNNKGPFSTRKDYIIFDKILTFEVSEYTAE
ncbi:N-acetylneuraminate epimerase [compost metagenome]